MEARTNGVRRQVTRVGDLAVAETADLLQQEYVAILFAECPERRIQLGGTREVAAAGHLRQLDECRTPRTSTHVIACQVAGNLEYPGPLAAVCSVAAAQGAQECLLGQVLGNRIVTKKASQEPVHRQAISLEETDDEIVIHCRSLVITMASGDPLIERDGRAFARAFGPLSRH